MQLAAFAAGLLITMLLARIFAPIAIVYLLPGTSAADVAARLIDYTADSSAMLLVVALVLLWAIKRKWRPGLWFGMAYSLLLVAWCGKGMFDLISSLYETPIYRGSLLLPPQPEPTTPSEAFLSSLSNLATPMNASSLLMILSLLVPSLLLAIGLWRAIWMRKDTLL